MKLWFWFDRQSYLGTRWGFIRGEFQRGHFWFWIWRINCGLILYNTILPTDQLAVIRHNVRCFLARRHGNKPVVTVAPVCGWPITLTVAHCDQLRRQLR